MNAVFQPRNLFFVGGDYCREMIDDYVRVNRANWDDRALLHPHSDGYDLNRFRRDPAAVSDVVRFDLPRLALGDYMEAHPTIPGEYWLKEGRERLPLSYTVQATKVDQPHAPLPATASPGYCEDLRQGL